MLPSDNKARRTDMTLMTHVGQPLNAGRQCTTYTRINLDAVAVGQVAVVPAGIVPVEEVLVVILVLLPPREQEANHKRDNEEDGQQRRLVGAQRLQSVRVER